MKKLGAGELKIKFCENAFENILIYVIMLDINMTIYI